MAVHTTKSKAGPYVADGSQTEFPFGFPVIEPKHLAVYIDNGRVGQDRYTVHQEGQVGGTVRFSVPPESGEKVTLLRDVPLTQETDIQNNTAFYPEVLETAYDKLTMICQQFSEELQRVVKVGVSESDVTPDALLKSVFDAGEGARESALAAQESSAEAADIVAAARETLDDARELVENSKGAPIGSMYPCPASMPPKGSYLLNGQTIANCSTIYPKFWEWVNAAGVRIIDDSTYEAELASAGVCGGFVVDSASGSVRLPYIVNGTLWGADSSNIGQSLAAGLPSITGTIASADPNGHTGAFKTYEGGNGLHWGTGTTTIGVDFDASRSSEIYGNSDTVQPPAIRVSWCIQVYNAATALSEQQSAELASLMQTKAQTDLANVTANLDFVVESWSAADGSSWYRKFRSGWIEQGGILDMGEVVYFADDTPINFPTEMRDTRYSFFLCPVLERGTGLMAMVKQRTNGYMTMWVRHRTDYASYFRYVSWYVCGYGATE